MYLYVNNNIAAELIPEFDDAVPDVPIEDRYSPEFLKDVFEIPEDIEVKMGWIVNTDTWEFTEPPVEPIEEIPDDLSALKDYAIEKTKDWLKSDLAKGMPYSKDGRTYNVTREKRADLTGVLLIGEMNKQNNVSDDQNILRWNVSGEEHENWFYKDLCALAYEMYLFVTPKIEKQERGEYDIKGADTREKITEILKDFN